MTSLSINEAVKKPEYSDIIEKTMPKPEFYLAVFFFIFLFVSVIYLSYSVFTFYSKLESSKKSGTTKDLWIGSIIIVVITFIVLITLTVLHFKLSGKISIKDNEDDVVTLRSKFQEKEVANDTSGRGPTVSYSQFGAN